MIKAKELANELLNMKIKEFSKSIMDSLLASIIAYSNHNKLNSFENLYLRSLIVQEMLFIIASINFESSCGNKETLDTTTELVCKAIRDYTKELQPIVEKKNE